jgi:murein tripeptide amidase MpaA
MGGWFMEGFLQKLLESENSISMSLLSKAVFYLIPNMNPDGTICGNIRTNAAGVDINRTWLNSSLEKSPEVYYVRNQMDTHGVDFFLDVHGDEAFSYVFVATAHQNPSYTDRLKKLNKDFIDLLIKYSSDFQNQHGYSDVDVPYEVSKHTASAYVADKFDCLSLTLEMPYKDNANAPDIYKGWSPERCKQLASSFLEVLEAIIPQLGRSEKGVCES